MKTPLYASLAIVPWVAVTLIMLATPVLTACIEWPLWGIELSLLQWLGAALILSGLVTLTGLEWRMASAQDEARVAAATNAGEGNHE